MSAAEKTGAGAGRGIEVRSCHALAEFERCMELEREVWGGTDRDQVPATIFVVADETGGQVLGAYDRASGRMVGFTLAMAGMHGQRLYLHSHMTAVTPAYQNRGIGRMLKLFQREDALRRGIELVEWTFDPLEIRNAYFNIVRLGAIVRRFKPNAYGITTSPLHGGIPTDRLVAEWWLRSQRVVTAVEKGSIAARTVQNPLGVRILVPREILAWKSADRAKAIEAQRAIREEFQKCFERGFAVSGLEVEDGGGQYFLEPYSDVPGMS